MAYEQQMDQVMAGIRSQTDLEDFMNYYEFDEGEKQAARTEWQQQQFQNQNQVQDRGLGKLLVGGFALKKIFGRKPAYGKKPGWQPGMGGQCGGGYGGGHAGHQGHHHRNMPGAGAAMGMGAQGNPNVPMGFEQNQCFQNQQPLGFPQQNTQQGYGGWNQQQQHMGHQQYPQQQYPQQQYPQQQYHQY